MNAPVARCSNGLYTILFTHSFKVSRLCVECKRCSQTDWLYYYLCSRISGQINFPAVRECRGAQTVLYTIQDFPATNFTAICECNGSSNGKYTVLFMHSQPDKVSGCAWNALISSNGLYSILIMPFQPDKTFGCVNAQGAPTACIRSHSGIPDRLNFPAVWMNAQGGSNGLY